MAASTYSHTSNTTTTGPAPPPIVYELCYVETTPSYQAPPQVIETYTNPNTAQIALYDAADSIHLEAQSNGTFVFATRSIRPRWNGFWFSIVFMQGYRNAEFFLR